MALVAPLAPPDRLGLINKSIIFRTLKKSFLYPRRVERASNMSGSVCSKGPMYTKCALGFCSAMDIITSLNSSVTSRSILFPITPIVKASSGILRKDGTTAFRGAFAEELKKSGHHGIPIDIIPLAELPGSGCYQTPTLSSFKKKAVYLKEWFEPAGEIQFEGITLRRPAKHRKILTEVYKGWDWPFGAQRCCPSFWFFDTETDYKVYIKRYTGMLDGIKGKKIYVFGAADSLRVWLERFDLKDQVVCTFDNDKGKWGKKSYGIEIRNPAEIAKVLDEDSRLIIVSIWHQEIGKQLEKMGITDYYVYVDYYYDEKIGNKVVRREDLPKGELEIPKWNG